MADKKPTMLQEHHPNIIDEIIEQQDLKHLLIDTLAKKGLVRADTNNISKNIRMNMKLPLFNFIANSSKFRTHFEKNSPIVNKSVIRSSYIGSYKNELSSFYSNCTWGVNSTYVRDLGKIMNKFNRIYIYNLGKFKSTFNFTKYVLKICELLRITVDTLIQLSNVQNVKNNEEAIEYTKSFFDKYIILTYEYYKVSLVYYLQDVKKNKTILIHILHNIDTFRIHYKYLYTELKPSKIKNIENDIACISFLKYYIRGNLAETEYDSLKSLTKQSILKMSSSTFQTFKPDENMYDKCIAFIYKGELAYEVLAEKASHIDLNIKFDRRTSLR